jgi:tetratricopeptide (TPR) repeat protein
MVARVASRQLDALLRDDSACRSAPALAVSAFFNALFGAPPSGSVAAAGADSSSATRKPEGGKNSRGKAKKQPQIKDASTTPAASAVALVAAKPPAPPSAASLVPPLVPKVVYPASDISSVQDVTRASLKALRLSFSDVWADITSEVRHKFKCNLKLWANGGHSEAAVGRSEASGASQGQAARTWPRVNYTALLRRICQRAGVQIAARSYDWAARGSSAGVFAPADILGLCPVVKSCMPESQLREASEIASEAADAFEVGRLNDAFHGFTQARELLFNVVGPIHRDIATLTHKVAMTLAAADQSQRSRAIAEQARAVTLYERLCGPDHLETAVAHRELAQYLGFHSVAALRHQTRYLSILQLMAPHSHPLIASAYHRLGMICLDLHDAQTAAACIQEAVSRSAFDPLQAAGFNLALASAHSLVGNFREALQCTKATIAFCEARCVSESLPNLI